MDHASVIEDERPTLSEAVVEAVATEEGVSSAELSTPLFDAVDPEALNNIFRNTKTNTRLAGSVTFQYHGYEVCVTDTGDVSLTEQ